MSCPLAKKEKRDLKDLRDIKDPREGHPVGDFVL
jgi:hypothetical protein